MRIMDLLSDTYDFIKENFWKKVIILNLIYAFLFTVAIFRVYGFNLLNPFRFIYTGLIGF